MSRRGARIAPRATARTRPCRMFVFTEALPRSTWVKRLETCEGEAAVTPPRTCGRIDGRRVLFEPEVENSRPRSLSGIPCRLR